MLEYKNELNRATMELALQLIEMKMTDLVHDARGIAMRIIKDFLPVHNRTLNGNHIYALTLAIINTHIISGNPTLLAMYYATPPPRKPTDGIGTWPHCGNTPHEGRVH